MFCDGVNLSMLASLSFYQYLYACKIYDSIYSNNFFLFASSNSLMGFGAVAGIGLLYFTDWRLILQYVPVVKRKFKEDS